MLLAQVDSNPEAIDWKAEAMRLAGRVEGLEIVVRTVLSKQWPNCPHQKHDPACPGCQSWAVLKAQGVLP